MGFGVEMNLEPGLFQHLKGRTSELILPAALGIPIDRMGPIQDREPRVVGAVPGTEGMPEGDVVVLKGMKVRHEFRDHKILADGFGDHDKNREVLRKVSGSDRKIGSLLIQPFIRPDADGHGDGLSARLQNRQIHGKGLCIQPPVVGIALSLDDPLTGCRCGERKDGHGQQNPRRQVKRPALREIHRSPGDPPKDCREEKQKNSQQQEVELGDLCRNDQIAYVGQGQTP